MTMIYDTPDTRAVAHGLIASGLFYALGVVSQLLFSKGKAYFKYREFQKVFGKSAAHTPSALSLCLPLWRVHECSRETTRFDKRLPSGERQALYGPDNLVAYADINGILSLNSLIVGFLKKPLDMVLDVDNFDTIDKNLIAVGSSIANCRVAGMVKQMERDFFTIEKTEETDENPSSMLIKDTDTGQIFDSCCDTEHALIGRVPIEGRPGNFHFFIFGAHDTGTTAACKYLANNWKDFLKAKEESPSAILLSMARGDIASVQVAKRYGFSNK